MKIKIELDVKKEDIENIVITALEGGIGYWACLVDDDIELSNYRQLSARKKLELSLSEVVAMALIDGARIFFYDAESGDDRTVWTLTLEKLLKGIERYIKKTSDLNYIDNMDASVADSIIQYALFEEVMFG